MTTVSLTGIAKKLEQKGYKVLRNDELLLVNSSHHLLSKGWIKIIPDGKEYRIIYGTKASTLGWIFGILFMALTLVLRALTIDNVNKESYSDAYRAIYGNEAPFMEKDVSKKAK